MRRTSPSNPVGPARKTVREQKFKISGSSRQILPNCAETFQRPRKGPNGAGVLSTEVSAILRDQLLAEMAGLGSKMIQPAHLLQCRWIAL
jgi:hypothetical protein